MATVKRGLLLMDVVLVLFESLTLKMSFISLYNTLGTTPFVVSILNFMLMRRREFSHQRKWACCFANITKKNCSKLLEICKDSL